MLNMKSIHPAAASLMEVMNDLNEAGHQAHLVGGAVRDALMGRTVKDLDISTSARPEAVMELFEEKGFAVHPTGIGHGTVTVLVEDEPFEITTWRRDVLTDGRRAVIAFADNMADDAFRRDLTINALYADRHGQVLDPTGQGLDDLEKKRLRFVGDATQRIHEDALRILRFFRFHSSLGVPLEDGDGLRACVQSSGLIRFLSRERIGMEMLKLLTGTTAGAVLTSMMENGVTNDLLPGCTYQSDEICGLFNRLDHACTALDIKRGIVVTLAALMEETPIDAYRLPYKVVKSVNAVRDASAEASGAEELGYRLGTLEGLSALAVRYAIQCPFTVLDRDAVIRGSEQVFPVKAKDLGPEFEGKHIGVELRRLEREWILSGFRSSGTDIKNDMSP